MKDEGNILDIIADQDLVALQQWLDDGGEANSVVGTNEFKSTLVEWVIDECEDDESIGLMLQLLIDKGADINVFYCEFGNYPLITAIREQRPILIQILLNAAGVNVDIKDIHDNTPLTLAVDLEDIDTFKKVLEISTKEIIHKSGTDWKLTPLGIAFAKVNLTMIEELLKSGANPYFIENSTQTSISNLPVDISIESKDKIDALVLKYSETVSGASER